MATEVNPLFDLTCEPLEPVAIKGARGLGRKAQLGASSFRDGKESLPYIEDVELPGVARLMQGGLVRNEEIAKRPETVEGRVVVRGNRGNVLKGVVERARKSRREVMHHACP